MIYQWDKNSFKPYQTLKGLSTRNFLFFKYQKKIYLLRINFIAGNRKSPETALDSLLYGEYFQQIQMIPTLGGVSAIYFKVMDKPLIAIANSLSKQVRFKTESKIYTLDN